MTEFPDSGADVYVVAYSWNPGANLTGNASVYFDVYLLDASESLSLEIRKYYSDGDPTIPFKMSIPIRILYKKDDGRFMWFPQVQ